MEYVKLNNGLVMPQFGLGTFLIPKERLSYTIAAAYEMGYRKFDTAWRYYNEKEIAQALKDNGIHREDVFITTKVHADALCFWGYHYGKHRILNIPRRTVRQAIDASFKNFGFEYIDMFLIHYPFPMYLKMYKVLTDYYKQGRIRALGLSSYLPPHIQSLKEVSDVSPALNQFEISPLNAQPKLVQYCLDNGIQPEAMSTFSHFRSNEPRLEIMENETLLQIAGKYNKSVVQIVLRWLIQRGISVIPKTWEEKHLRENIDIFNFNLSDDDMQTISSLDRGKFLNYSPYGGMSVLPKKYRDWEGF